MSKLKICFEGSSGIGKSMLCENLTKTIAFPEVNQLYERVENESEFWHLVKQVERFKSI